MCTSQVPPVREALLPYRWRLELRKAIVAAAAALAAIAEEIAWIDQDPGTRRPGGAAESQRMAGEASETAGTAWQAGRTSGPRLGFHPPSTCPSGT
jgi:hypothetical protein